MKGIVALENDVIKEVIFPIADEIRKSDNLMVNYLVNYFNLLFRQINNYNESGVTVSCKIGLCCWVF